MIALWNIIFFEPILNGLVFLYKNTGNLGVSIILLTIAIRTILIPIVIPSMKGIKKQRELKPEIDKLKKKYKKDQKMLAQKQMELFKKHGINPTSGCLTQVAMIIVIIALYNAIRMFTLNNDFAEINSHLYSEALKLATDEVIPTKFLYLDLTKPDRFFVLALLSGGLQFLVTKMSMPYVKEAEKAAKKTEGKADDMAMNIQKQAMFMMPLMNVFIGVTLPSGIMLYIITQSLFTMVQTFVINGWGGLKPWIDKIKLT